MTKELREFKAIVGWSKASNELGKSVSIWAKDLLEAKRLLDEEYGEENVFDLHNEEDADKPR